MLKAYFKYLFLFSILYSCSSDNDLSTPKKYTVDIVKTFGGTRNESAQSVVATNDGGYLVLGFTQSIDGDVSTSKTSIQYDYWLLKFDKSDQLQWQKTLGGTQDEKAYKIIRTNDAGFTIVGYSKSNNGDLSSNEGFEDVWILKLDATGTIVWKTNTGFSGSDQGYTIVQTSDGGYFVGAILDVTASGGQGNARARNASRHAGGDYWALKLNASGTIEWRRYFGGANTDTCYDALETNDGYILVGSSDSNDVDIKGNKGTYDFWVVKIDKTGKLLWEKSYGGSEIDEARAITKTNDGNFIIIGDTRSTDKDVSKNNGGADLWLIKIDTTGKLLWEKTIGGSSFDVGRSIQKTTDGGYLISGSSRSNDNSIINKGQNDAWILKIDNKGNQQWQQTVGGNNIDFCYDATELSNGIIIGVGESSSNSGDISTNKGFSDALVIKLK